MPDLKDLKGTFILWLNYHSEGWIPTASSDYLQDIVDAIQAGETYGNEFIVTRRMDLGLSVRIMKPQEKPNVTRT